MPRPLSSFNPQGSIVVGNTGRGFNIPNPALFICNAHTYPLEERPKFAFLAMRVISAWATLDSYVARSLGAMVGGSIDVAVAMYNALGSTASQQAALTAAAAASIPAPQRLLLQALIGRYNKIQKARNRVAHHLWGISAAAPDGIILLDPKEYEEILGDIQNVKWDKISVFDEADFLGWVASIEQLSAWFHDFYFMVGPHAQRADSLLQRLTEVPEIQRLLDRLRKKAETPPPEPPSQPPQPPPTEAP